MNGLQGGSMEGLQGGRGRAQSSYQLINYIRAEKSNCTMSSTSSPLAACCKYPTHCSKSQERL